MRTIEELMVEFRDAIAPRLSPGYTSLVVEPDDGGEFYSEGDLCFVVKACYNGHKVSVAVQLADNEFAQDVFVPTQSVVVTYMNKRAASLGIPHVIS